MEDSDAEQGDNMTAAFIPDPALLQAVENAADDNGWATADEIRWLLDGKTARGRWARTLHAHADQGYLERASWSGPYALTQDGFNVAGSFDRG